MSTKQAAKILGVDDSRVRQLILSGKLPSMQIGRAHLIKEADLALVTTYGKAGRPKKEGEVSAVANGSTSAKTTTRPVTKKAANKTAKK